MSDTLILLPTYNNAGKGAPALLARKGEREAFERHVDKTTAGYPDALRDTLLHIYANPLIRR